MANPYQGDDVDPFSAARDEEGNIKRGEAAQPEPLKMASFKEAFREARDRGEKTFEYMGKKYTTELAGEKKAAEPKTAFQKRAEKQTAAREARAASSAERKSRPIGMASDIVGAKKGGSVKVSSASKRADGIAQRGKTRGKMV